MKQMIAPILSNKEVTQGVHLLWVQAPEIAALAQPGQFVMVRCSEGYERLLRRPLSMHRVDPLHSPERLALLFAVVGGGTHWLAQRKEGDTIDLTGPLGHGFVIDPASRNLLLVAGGVGIAPLVALGEAAIKNGFEVTLIQGAATRAQLYPADKLPAEVTVLSVTEDGSAGRKGIVTDFLPELCEKADQIFACGPVPMYQAMAAQEALRGKRAQVSLEARMGCGLGYCYGCTVETQTGLALVCKDGPVFDLGGISWQSKLLNNAGCRAGGG